MGTETGSFTSDFSATFLVAVKLNNPLMGTETRNRLDYYSEDMLRVKLNNPLMGTETSISQVFFFLCRSVGLI